jgi:hypothetical protein
VPSRLGLQLVSSLALFGLVEHKVWEEMTCMESCRDRCGWRSSAQ